MHPELVACTQAQRCTMEKLNQKKNCYFSSEKDISLAVAAASAGIMVWLWPGVLPLFTLYKLPQ